jgi:3-hydroxyisobutyrate dehydrogenase-like beta-hydroxyacid dehydrogenase
MTRIMAERRRDCTQYPAKPAGTADSGAANRCYCTQTTAEVGSRPMGPLAGERAPTAAVLGLGEAGAAIARDLAGAGWAVRGWDIREGLAVDGVAVARELSAAAPGADLVVSLVTAASARAVAESAAPLLAAGTVYADLNTAAAGLKRELATVVEASGAAFADVAVLAPVPGRGLRTPLLASGSGAARLAELLRPFGATVDVVAGPPGAAASRKLIRSVLMKGLAAALLEADAAARAADCEAWFLDDAARTFEAADAALVDRLLDGTRAHAARRLHELEDAAAQLRELGVEPRITDAAHAVLEEIDS